jgi:hypothetical protein
MDKQATVLLPLTSRHCHATEEKERFSSFTKKMICPRELKDREPLACTRSPTLALAAAAKPQKPDLLRRGYECLRMRYTCSKISIRRFGI